MSIYITQFISIFTYTRVWKFSADKIWSNKDKRIKMPCPMPDRVKEPIFNRWPFLKTSISYELFFLKMSPTFVSSEVVWSRLYLEIFSLIMIVLRACFHEVAAISLTMRVTRWIVLHLLQQRSASLAILKKQIGLFLNFGSNNAANLLSCPETILHGYEFIFICHNLGHLIVELGLQ